MTDKLDEAAIVVLARAAALNVRTATEFKADHLVEVAILTTRALAAQAEAIVKHLEGLKR
jgi:hypothetical protein